MTEIRYIHIADEIYGKVYIAGGLNTENGTYPTTMLVYDRDSSTWTQISLPGNSVRGQHTSCVVDSNLYLIGGVILVSGTINSTTEMYMFKPSTSEWILKNPMPTDRNNLACALLDGKICMYGGSYRTHPNIGILDIWEFNLSPVSVEDDVSAPLEFSLEQNYPTPFNPSTKIKYSVPQSSQIQIKDFDVLGNEIATLIDEYKPGGNYEVDFQSAVCNSQLASGVYFYQLKTGAFIEKKMILLR